MRSGYRPRERRAALRELLDDDDRAEDVHARAAVLFRHRQAGHAEPAQSLEDVLRMRGRLVVAARGFPRQLAIEEAKR